MRLPVNEWETTRMIHDYCRLLDDYLAGDLNADATGAFEAHLTGCIDCSAEIELQRMIDRSLVEANQSVTLPPGLVVAIERRVQRTRRRRLTWSVSAAAAAVILAGALIVMNLSSPHREPTLSEANQIGRQDVTPGSPKDNVADGTGPTHEVRRVQLTFPIDQDIIPLEMKTKDPTVTVVLLYPAFSRQAAGVAE